MEELIKDDVTEQSTQNEIPEAVVMLEEDETQTMIFGQYHRWGSGGEA